MIIRNAIKDLVQNIIPCDELEQLGHTDVSFWYVIKEDH